MKRVLFTVIIGLFLVEPLGLVYGKPLGQNVLEIQLKSRKFSPPADRPIAFNTVIARAKGERVHMLLQFERIPDAEQKFALQQAGVQLLNYVPHNTWFASVPVSLAAGIRPCPSCVGSVRSSRRTSWSLDCAPGVSGQGPVRRRVACG